MLGKAGVGALLVAATLALSGCWANVYNFSDGTRNITLTKAISARIVFVCTRDQGTGAPRAFCALDTVKALCQGKPIRGVDNNDCIAMSSYGTWTSMDLAIQHVAEGPDPCISYFDENTGHTSDNFWGTVPDGFAGCK
jgi:hypothetical protein